MIGLPGVGKTTIKNQLITKDIHDYSTYKKESSKKIMLLFFFINNSFYFLYLFIIFIKINGLCSLYSLGKRYRKLVSMTYTINNIKRHNSTYIMDQGLSQMFVSLNISMEEDNNQRISVLLKKHITHFKLNKFIINVLIEADIKTVINRVYLREKKTCEFKNMSRENLLKNLICYKSFYDYIDIDIRHSAKSESSFLSLKERLNNL